MSQSNASHFIGQVVTVVGITSGNKKQGQVLDWDGQGLTLETNGEKCFIPFSSISIMKLAQPAAVSASKEEFDDEVEASEAQFVSESGPGYDDSGF